MRAKGSWSERLKLLAIVFISTLVVWAPFYFNGKMERVFANYDGPNYIVIAKCWYNKTCTGSTFSLPLPLEYYPAHLPGYPALITLFDQVLPGWWAMLLVNLLATGAAALAFYLLLKQLKLKAPFWLAAIFLFLPARMLILRTVGAPETLFISAIILSILFFREKRYLPSGIFLALAQVIKTPAILLFLAYLATIFLKRAFKNKKVIIAPKKLLSYWPLLLGPLTLLPVFYFYQIQTGDFMAYFHSGDNFHLVFPPFQTFISSRSWLGDFWLEEIIYVYLIGGLAVAYLIKKYKTDIIAVFPTVFYLATLMVAHRDISRYSSPMYPFWIIAFSGLLVKKEFRIIFLILLPAVYLYAINFINYNLAPIADWAPYY